MFVGNETIKVLIIDDDEDDYILTNDIISEITNSKYHVEWQFNYNKALETIFEQRHDIYIIDFYLGSNTALEILYELSQKSILAPVIILTGQENKGIDLQLMNAGASDYLIKPELTPSSVERSIRYAISTIAQLKQLKEEEQKFRGLFEESVDAIFLCSCDLTISEANHSFLNLFEYTKEEIKGLSASSLFLEEQDLVAFKNQLINTTDLNKEVILLNKNKKEIECQIATTPIRDFDEKTKSYQVIIHDLTLRKKAERELMQAELLSVTGKMARSMAHEVRNPLTNLVLALNELEDVVETTEDTIIFTDIIKRNSKRIDQIITEMLNSSRKSIIQKQKNDITKIIEDSVAVVLDRITLQNMQLKLDISNAPIEIQLDAKQFKLALNNILINAVEAMEEGSGLLKISCLTKDNFVHIIIEDNGIGMERETINKLFNPFFTSKKGGMGLGLTTVLNIIKGHDGTIDIESELHHGSRFIIQLPI